MTPVSMFHFEYLINFQQVVRAAFIPFGDLVDVQIPLDYETEKHRGFAFIEYELPEDAQAAIDNMNDSEMFGRTLRVNIAKPLRIKENSSRPVWQDEEWLQVFLLFSVKMKFYSILHSFCVCRGSFHMLKVI